MAGCRLGTRDNHRHRDHFIELQPFFTGINTGDCAAENQAARASRGRQRLTFADGLFHLLVGVIEDVLQRFLPYLGRWFRHRVVGDWTVDDVVIVARIVVRGDPAQFWFAGSRSGLF